VAHGLEVVLLKSSTTQAVGKRRYNTKVPKALVGQRRVSPSKTPAAGHIGHRFTSWNSRNNWLNTVCTADAVALCGNDGQGGNPDAKKPRETYLVDVMDTVMHAALGCGPKVRGPFAHLRMILPPTVDFASMARKFVMSSSGG
jgi:hypothetical protein